jgi:hypothetical protein
VIGPNQETSMDLLFIGIVVVFFVLCWAFVRLCEKV